MNNWDVNRPEITVVYGAPDVPQWAVQEVVKETKELRQHEDSTTIQNEDTSDKHPIFNKHPIFHVMGHENLEDGHLMEVINALEDHILNTNVDDWLDHQSDMRVDDRNDLWVNIGWGKYYGPNCTVDAWFVSI